MAENEGSRRSKGLIPAVAGSLLALGLILMIAKVFLNPPERRPREVCYPIYRLGVFTLVTIPNAVVPGEPLFVLRNLSRMDSFYVSCKASLEPLKHWELGGGWATSDFVYPRFG